MPASRSVVSTLLRELGDFSLRPQGRPCGRPPAARRPGNDAAVTGEPASPSNQPAPTPQPDRHLVLARPGGHIGATHGRSTRDNSGQRRPVVVPGEPPYSGDDAGRPATPVLSRTEEVRGSNPLTSTPKHCRSERRRSHIGALWSFLGPPGPYWGTAGRRRRACPGDRGARCRPRAQVALQVPDRGAAQGGATGGSPDVRRVRRPTGPTPTSSWPLGSRACRGRWPGVRVAPWV